MWNCLAILQGALAGWNLELALTRSAFILLGMATVAVCVALGLTLSRGVHD
jgi:hypothetical protein